MSPETSHSDLSSIKHSIKLISEVVIFCFYHNTTLEKSHRTGGMGHISAFPFANLKSLGCKMRACLCSFDLA